MRLAHRSMTIKDGHIPFNMRTTCDDTPFLHVIISICHDFILCLWESLLLILALCFHVIIVMLSLLCAMLSPMVVRCHPRSWVSVGTPSHLLAWGMVPHGWVVWCLLLLRFSSLDVACVDLDFYYLFMWM